MRWQINDYIFCENQQSLTVGTEAHQLEPMVVELLAYFCRNPGQIISRDELVNSVWQGRVITDNAVNRVVTKLRKAFNDDVKKPQILATFPKKGYKFIATVEPVVNTDSHTSEKNIQVVGNLSKKAKTKTPQWIYLATGMLITVLLGLLLAKYLTHVSELTTQVKALTREPGRESRPQVSPDGRFLAYIEVRDKKMRQWIKSLADETAVEVSHGVEQRTWVDSLSWNQDGSHFVYLVTTPQSCQYFLRTFKQMKLGEPELIHNCPVGSYGKIAYTHDDNRVVYAESTGGGSPFSLFEMNLKSKEKRRLTQPELFLGGNSQFDLHPKDNKLLVSSPDEQQWEGFYSVDLDSNEMKLLFKQDAYICCGIWNHQGDRVVLMGEHPAHDLVSYDLQGNDQRIIYSSSEQLRSPERHSNGKDYLFSVLQANQNIHYFNFESNTEQVLVNSSVNDRLASFSQDSKLIAYVSISSGSEEVWVAGLDEKQKSKLTHFDDSRHYLDLQWSYNGKYLLALTLNEIHLINSESGKAQVLKIPQVEIRGMSWKNNEVISYSSKTLQGWQLNFYDINTHQVTAGDDTWAFVSYALNANDVLKQDHKGQLFVGEKNFKITDQEIETVDFLTGRVFNLKKSGNKWVWQQRADRSYQLMLKTTDQETSIQTLASDSYHFDLSQKGILYLRVDNLNADIYQTTNP